MSGRRIVDAAQHEATVSAFYIAPYASQKRVGTDAFQLQGRLKSRPFLYAFKSGKSLAAGENVFDEKLGDGRRNDPLFYGKPDIPVVGHIQRQPYDTIVPRVENEVMDDAHAKPAFHHRQQGEVIGRFISYAGLNRQRVQKVMHLKVEYFI